MDKAPYVIVQDTIDKDTWWAAIANAPRHLQIVQTCDHCWHTLVQTEMCCWCGQPRTLQHGPYLPEGDEARGRG